MRLGERALEFVELGWREASAVPFWLCVFIVSKIVACDTTVAAVGLQVGARSKCVLIKLFYLKYSLYIMFLELN